MYQRGEQLLMQVFFAAQLGILQVTVSLRQQLWRISVFALILSGFALISVMMWERRRTGGHRCMISVTMRMNTPARYAAPQRLTRLYVSNSDVAI